MPKRGAIALAITSVAVVLVLSFKTPSATSATGHSPTPAIVDPATNAPAASLTPSATSGTAATPTPTSTAASGTLRDGTYTGQVVETRYGPVQVEADVSGGRIVSVNALQLPSDHPRSAEISSVAGPILAEEALQAQSASIDFVSGATFTSDGYERSLQSALDQAA